MTRVPTPRGGVYSVKYRFVYDDVFLIAEMDQNSGKQWLIMRKVDPRTLNVLLEDRIQCIHTAVTSVSVEDFEKKITEEDFEPEISEDELGPDMVEETEPDIMEEELELDTADEEPEVVVAEEEPEPDIKEDVSELPDAEEGTAPDNGEDEIIIEGETDFDIETEVQVWEAVESLREIKDIDPERWQALDVPQRLASSLVLTTLWPSLLVQVFQSTRLIIALNTILAIGGMSLRSMTKSVNCPSLMSVSLYIGLNTV